MLSVASTLNCTALQTAEITDGSALMLIFRAGRGRLTSIRHNTHPESFFIAIYHESTFVRHSFKSQDFVSECDFVFCQK